MLKPGDIHGKKILFGCLDWGSGHVSRSIPLIHQLAKENEIIVWCSGSQKEIFEQFELPVFYYIGFDQDFNFKGDGNFFFEMLRNALSFRRKIKRERRAVRKFAAENKIDLIISDHRYGLQCSKVDSIFLTHQVNLPARCGFPARKIHRNWVKKFSFVWIIDSEQQRLAGSLSESVENSIYIGHFSRFSSLEIPVKKTLKYLAVISGPKEYAKQFYDEVLRFAQKHPDDFGIVCNESIADRSSSIQHYHNWKEADRAIASAETIISRCGYSTLMDLKVLEAKAILIPTPGQLEQEYLANYLSENSSDWIFLKHISELRII